MWRTVAVRSTSSCIALMADVVLLHGLIHHLARNAWVELSWQGRHQAAINRPTTGSLPQQTLREIYQALALLKVSGDVRWADNALAEGRNVAL